MTLGSMASNRYSAPFREDVTGWIAKLSTVSEIVEQWLMVQSMWMYMEAVFSGGDIVKQLPQEAKRFQNIDKSFSKVCSCLASVARYCMFFMSAGVSSSLNSLQVSPPALQSCGFVTVIGLSKHY